MALQFLCRVITLAMVLLATGCSIKHPVADDYPQYLTNNQGSTRYPAGRIAESYQLPDQTENHRYEFRSAMVGYGHLWIVEFGRILDATMQSSDVVEALGVMNKLDPRMSPNGITIVFDLQNYAFSDFSAHLVLTILVKNGEGVFFKKTYIADGNSQGGKMFWGGPFGMKNAVQQSTKFALDRVIGEFIHDMKRNSSNSAARP